MIRQFIFPFVLLGVIAFAGCGGGVQLHGTVTFDDGSPVDTGTVCFVSSGSSGMARGDLQSDGTYILSTNKPGDGVLPGTYNVYLINTEKVEQIPLGGSGDFTEKTSQTVNAKYTSSNSGITCTVDRSTKTFDFQVERYKKK